MRHVTRFIASLTIGAKISLLFLLLSFPIGHLTWLFVQQVGKDIVFAEHELAGSGALRTLWPSFSTTARGEAADATSVAALDAGMFKAQEAVRGFHQALLGPDRVLAAQAGQNAIQKIADGSNLTLDPDVDSFYMMDLTTVRLPELALARGLLARALLTFAEPPARWTNLDRDRIVEAAARFETARSAVQASARSGLDGNADGQLARRLERPLAALDKAAGVLAATAQDLRHGLATGQPAPVAAARSQAEAAAVGVAADELWKETNAALDGLIEARIAGFRFREIRDLGIAALGGLLALVAAAMVVRAIRRPIGDIIAGLRRFQQNDFSQATPHLDLGNEVGEIARAIERGREEAARTALTIAAMNQSPSMVMITDPGENIIFISATLAALLNRLEPAFRAADPQFAAAGLIGRHLDSYRANAALKRTLILDNGEARKARYDIAGEVLMVDMSYINTADGRTIGHTLVWYNATEELRGQAEVAAVVSAAEQGDFSARLPLAGKDGFVREIAIGLNNVSELVEQATRDFAEVMDAVAAGDLTRIVEGRYRGVLGMLQHGINQTIARLSDTVSTIQVTTSDVRLAAGEISTGADDLAKRTEEQASSLQETAATTEQLAASVKTTAENSRRAAAVAGQARTQAQAGGRIATDAVAAMARIEEASKKISDITRVIDDIAFQTNLLALNAAVEAARAGDAGKGFAVVASEVRTLAQRSGEAAKDISSLIASTNTEIGEGVKLVRLAGDSLNGLLDASDKVAATIADISAATSEQAGGIEEMSQTVAHLDEGTQANAALAEESAASATALSARIGELNAMMARFRTAKAEPRATPLRLEPAA
jgi:methyl-accepting chemotaxis protein